MKVVLELNDETTQLVRQVIDANQGENNTHGPLSFEVLGMMLFEDVALTVKRPGCWEASNMSTALSSHGYTAW